MGRNVGSGVDAGVGRRTAYRSAPPATAATQSASAWQAAYRTVLAKMAASDSVLVRPRVE